MVSLIFEIILFVAGMIAFISGKLNIPGLFSLEGRRAKTAGVLLMAPLLLGILTSFLIGLLAAEGVISTDFLTLAGYCDIAYVILGAAGAAIFAHLTK